MSVDLDFIARLMRSLDDEVEKYKIDLSKDEVARRLACAINAGERNPLRIRALTLGTEAPPVSWLIH